MKAGFIGAGKVGFTLGKYLVENGVTVTGYYSRSQESAQSAADFTNTNMYDSIVNILSDSDTLFITVPDGAISEIWDYMQNLDIKNKNICHCSGSISSTVFFNGEKKGAYVYSIHPLYAISDKYTSWSELHNAYFTIEGSAAHLDVIKEVFTNIGNQVVVISDENKALYHCSAAVVSNLVNGLYTMGADILCQCGFTKEDAQKALMPLFIGNARALESKGATKALTGPVERNDILTVKKHLDALSYDDTYKLAYTLLTEKLVDIAKEKHSQRDYTNMMEVINHEKHSIHF